MNYQLTKSSPKTGLPAKIRNQIITLQKGQKKTITASGLKCTIKRDKCFTIQFGNIEVDAEGKLDTIILLDDLNFLRNGKSILVLRSL